MRNEHLSTPAHEYILAQGNPAAERGTRIVVWITLVMMVVEIAAGWWFNSMALLADGWHMSSHALAIGLSAFAYSAARRYARDPSFAFGSWKIEVLAGYTSAVFLMGIALLMIFSSLERVLAPQPIHYLEAIVVAVIGLAVNIVCAFILGGAHHHGGGEDESAHVSHSKPHDHGDHDLNLKSAYVHVITDAATSVLAVVALAGGWLYGWSWLDPAMGIVGALLVAVWAKNLIGQTGKVLLDREMDHPVVEEIRVAMETGPAEGNTKVTDLHVWRVGQRAYSCALSVITNDLSLTPQTLRERIAVHQEIVHTTIEIHHSAS